MMVSEKTNIAAVKGGTEQGKGEDYETDTGRLVANFIISLL